MILVFIVCNACNVDASILSGLDPEVLTVLVVDHNVSVPPAGCPGLLHCKKSHVGMRQIPMLKMVAQNQRTWE